MIYFLPTFARKLRFNQSTLNERLKVDGIQITDVTLLILGLFDRIEFFKELPYVDSYFIFLSKILLMI